MFNGSIPAMITPFNGSDIDFSALRSLIDWHIDQGSSALVICGTTGEAPTLSNDEHIAVVEAAVACARGRIPIIAGAGSNSTSEAVALTQSAERAGAAATLHATGYYNKPSQHQLINYYQDIAAATNRPVLLYNIPSRTGVDISIDSIYTLSELGCISGTKDSTGDVSRVTQERLRVTKPFCFLSGDDSTALGYIAHGGHGCISVTANVAPRLYADMISAALSGEFSYARTLQDRMMPLHKALFVEPSPGGIKYAMSRFGLCREDIRAPLTPISDAARAQIDAALAFSGLLNSGSL
jgi:4-hydroxy-tetrahydrodipicolinate synthase